MILALIYGVVINEVQMYAKPRKVCCCFLLGLNFLFTFLTYQMFVYIQVLPWTEQNVVQDVGVSMGIVSP